MLSGCPFVLTDLILGQMMPFMHALVHDSSLPAAVFDISGILILANNFCV
jgi:hypothetical protein